MRRRAFLAAISAVATLWFLLPAGVGASVPANGRAWELVSPADPMAAIVRVTAPPAATGSKVSFGTFGPVPGAPSGSFLSFNQAVRGAEGWTTTPIGFPYSINTTNFYIAVSPQMLPVSPVDGEVASLWVSTVPLTPTGPPEGDIGLYRRDAYNTLTPIADIGKAEALFSYGGYIDQSTDGRHVVFDTEEHLLAGDAGRTEGKSIYESFEGGLRLVDVDNGGSLLSSCGSLIAHPQGEKHAFSDGENRISANGERIFFTSPDPETSCPGPSEVYLREGADRTVEVSASQCTRPDCDAPQDVSFAGATLDGANVFLTTSQQLTNDDTNSLRDLYRYDVGDETLTLLTPRPPSATGEALTVGLHSSSDGSYVYFYATGHLLPGEGSDYETNLYLADPSGLHFVAVAGPGGNGFPGENLQMTPDGRTVVFGTSESISGGDTDGRRSDVYLYHADDQSLTHVSSGSTGGNGMFEAYIFAPYEWETVVPGRPLLYHAMSDDGKDVFFSTKEQLVPEDVNYAIDIYEWREGDVGLVSAGTGTSDAEFGGATPDGQTVFFRTADSLTPADHDGGDIDLYAARVGGGFAESTSPAPGCTGPCRAAPPKGVERPIPSSAAYRRHEAEGRIRLLKISTGKADASGPDATLLVAVPSPGLVSASASRPGMGKAIVARGSAGAIRPGKLRIPLRLSKAAERLLAQGGSLKVRLLIREGEQRLTSTVTLAPGASR